MLVLGGARAVRYHLFDPIDRSIPSFSSAWSPRKRTHALFLLHSVNGGKAITVWFWKRKRVLLVPWLRLREMAFLFFSFRFLSFFFLSFFSEYGLARQLAFARGICLTASKAG